MLIWRLKYSTRGTNAIQRIFKPPSERLYFICARKKKQPILNKSLSSLQIMRPPVTAELLIAKFMLT